MWNERKIHCNNIGPDFALTYTSFNGSNSIDFHRITLDWIRIRLIRIRVGDEAVLWIVLGSYPTILRTEETTAYTTLSLILL